MTSVVNLNSKNFKSLDSNISRLFSLCAIGWNKLNISMTNKIVVLLLLGTTVSLQAQENEVDFIAVNSVSHIMRTDTFVSLATSFLGVPYHYGGITPEQGFDCSGFVKFVFSHFGFDIPRTTVGIADCGEEIHVDSCKKGDIILFAGRDEKSAQLAMSEL
tara:strand:- start:867 stop:1346 length:480 start_codon:yes stop_codon:yes gene_type:complete